MRENNIELEEIVSRGHGSKCAVFELAVDDNYIRSNPSDNVLRKLKQSHCFQFRGDIE